MVDHGMAERREKRSNDESESPDPRRSTGGGESSDSERRDRSHSDPSSESESGAQQEGAGSESDERVRGTAPSAADITKLEKFEPSEEAKRHEPSTVDAMGQDKRRQIVGQTYGPTKRSQIMFFVAVAAVLVVVVGGWLALVAAFDNPPERFSDRAPWSTTPADQQLAAEQKAKPVSPLTPCGEPGNEYPVPPESPCAPPNKANDFQGSSTGQ